MGSNEINLTPAPLLSESGTKMFQWRDVDGDGKEDKMAYTGLGQMSINTVDRLTRVHDAFDSTGQKMRGNVTGGGGFWTGGHDSLFIYSPEGVTNKLGLAFEDYQWVEKTYSNGYQIEFDPKTCALKVYILTDNLSSTDERYGSGGYQTGEVVNQFNNGKGDNLSCVVNNNNDNGINGQILWDKLTGDTIFTERDILKDLIELTLEDTARQEHTSGWAGAIGIGRDDADHNPEVTESCESFFSNYAKALASGGHSDKFIELIDVAKDAVGYKRTKEVLTKDTNLSSLVDLASEVIKNDDRYSGDNKAKLENLAKMARALSEAGAPSNEIKSMVENYLNNARLGSTSEHEAARDKFKSAALRGEESAAEKFLKDIGTVPPPAKTSSRTASAAAQPSSSEPTAQPHSPNPEKVNEQPSPASTRAQDLDRATFSARILEKTNSIQAKFADTDTDSKFIEQIDEAFAILNSDEAFNEKSEAIQTFLDAFADTDGRNILGDALKGKSDADKKAILKTYANSISDKYIQENGSYETDNFSEAKSARETAYLAKGLIDFTQSQFINPKHIKRNDAQQGAVIADMERFMTGRHVEGDFEALFNLETANPPPFFASEANPALVQGMWDTSKNAPGSFNINAIFDGKTSVDDLAQMMVDYNAQYGLPAELTDKSEEVTKLSLVTSQEALQSFVKKMGLEKGSQVTFRIQDGKVKASSIPTLYADFLRAVYPDKAPEDVLKDKSLVDMNNGNLDINAFYNTVLSDISKADQASLKRLQNELSSLGMGNLFAEKTFYKGFTKEEYKAAILRYLQQLDAYRMHFQDNINPLGNDDLDPLILSTFGDLYPEYK